MNNENQKKKLLLTALIVTSIIFFVVLVILLVLMNQESKKTKIQLGNNIYKTKTEELTANDGVYIKKSIEYNKINLPILVITPSNQYYYCIETLSRMTNYKYNNGAYGDQIDESKDKCYIDNGGEYVTFITGSNKITKTIKNSDKYEGELKDIESSQKSNNSSSSTTGNSQVDDLEESFTFENSPVIKFDDKLYASSEAINKGFNLIIQQEKDSTLNIRTLNSLIDSYSKSLSSSGYTLTKNFKNQRALSDSYAVVGKDNKYGVIDLKNGNEIISVKYDTVEYVQSIGEFIVSQKSKFGMIKPGEQSPTLDGYESIELLDPEKKLYIVKQNKKFGVYNSNGERIVPTEYDQIGLDDITAYQGQGITNRYIISNECIPVKRNNLYGLYSLNGDIIQRAHFNGFGCEDPSKILNNTNAMPTLTIPFSDEINTIVFSSKLNNETVYGIVSTNGVVIMNSFYSAIYYTKKDDKIEYYFHRPSTDESYTLGYLIRTRQQYRDMIEQAKKGREQKELEEEKEKENDEIISSQEVKSDEDNENYNEDENLEPEETEGE